MKISKEALHRLMAGAFHVPYLLACYYMLVIASSALAAMLPQIMSAATAHAVAGDQHAVTKVIALYALASIGIALSSKIVRGRTASALSIFFYGDTVKRLWVTNEDAANVAAKARATYALRSVIIADAPEVVKTIIGISVVLTGLAALGPKHVALGCVALVVGAGVTYLGSDALKALVAKFHEFSHMEVDVVASKDAGRLTTYLNDKEQATLSSIKLDAVQWVVQAPVISAMTLASYWLSDGSAVSLALIMASYATIAKSVDSFSVVQRSILSALQALKHTE